MSYVIRVVLGTVVTLVGIVYLASCDQSPSHTATNLMKANTQPSVVVASDNGHTDCAVVERVVDGDTIVVTPNRAVRMIGITAPELTTPLGTPEVYAEESYAKLKSLVEGKRVCLRKDDMQEDKDPYGRDLRYVFIDEQNINALMVEGGFARVYTQAPFEELDPFRYYQNAAQARGIGMWQTATPPVATSTTQTETTSPTFTDEEVVSLSPEGGTVATQAELDAETYTDIPRFTTTTNGNGETFVTESANGGEKYFLTIEEAINGKKYLGQRKKISFRVRSAWDRGNIVYINSEKQQENAKNFSIMIYSRNRSTFTEKGLDSIAHFYLGETIEAEGIIKFYQGKVIMEVTQFEDIRIL